MIIQENFLEVRQNLNVYIKKPTLSLEKLEQNNQYQYIP